MVRILVVEDEEDFFENIKQACDDTGIDVEIVWAKSLEAALGEASAGFFDLTILDQKIPTVDGALDAHVDHGRAVWNELYKTSPGMPVLILTALSADDIISTVLKRSKYQRIWGGDAKFSTVEHLGKGKFEKFPTLILSYLHAIASLRDMEVLTDGDTVLDDQHLRLCKLFVGRSNGVRCEVKSLSGGLSGSAVYLLHVFNETGGKIQNAVLKVGSKNMVETEIANLSLISRLPAAASPRFLEPLFFGAKDMAAIAYQLADGYDRNIFDVIQNYPDHISIALEGVSSQRTNWTEAKSERRITVADVRRCVLSDEDSRTLSQEYDLDWLEAFEARALQVHWGCIHGDLHGENILLNDDSIPVFIDYGDVAEGPIAIDWMTLECSTLFHPSAGRIYGSDPVPVNPSDWSNVGSYCENPNLAKFYEHCRQKAASEGLLPRELIAAAFSYVLRQLKYEDTDKKLALELLENLRVQFDQ